MDRFNRPIIDRWQREITGSVQPKVLDLAPGYDVEGSVVSLTDGILHDGNSTPRRAFDMLISYDNLRRMIERDEGQVASGAIATADRKRRELTARNGAGRITSDKVNLDWSGTDDEYKSGPLSGMDGGEMDDGRTYNNRNELVGRAYSDSSPGSPYTRTLTYDKNGNLTSDGEKYDYVYNPWGQLVQIKLFGTTTKAAVYTYNGLGQRISEQLDCNDAANSGKSDAVVDSNDPVCFMAVDPQGRRVATYRGTTDQYPKETFVYHGGGARGPAFSGGVLVRDRNASLTDPTKWATEVAGAVRAERDYYCADFRGNVAAMVDSAGNLVEQYRYGPSGVPYGIPLGDMNADGVVDGAKGAADYVIVNGIIAVSGYEDRADLNLDGVVNAADKTIVASNDGHATGRGKMSVGAVGNRKAYSLCEQFGQGFYALHWSAGAVSLPALELSLNSTVARTPPSSDNNVQTGSMSSLLLDVYSSCPSTGIISCLGCCRFGWQKLGGSQSGYYACVNACFDTSIPPLEDWPFPRIKPGDQSIPITPREPSTIVPSPSDDNPFDQWPNDGPGWHFHCYDRIQITPGAGGSGVHITHQWFCEWIYVY